MIGPDGALAARRERVQRATIVGLVAAIAMVGAALGVSMALDDDDGDGRARVVREASGSTTTSEPPATTVSSTAPVSSSPPSTDTTTTVPTTTAPPTSVAPPTTAPPLTTAPVRPSLRSDVDGDGAADAVVLARDATSGSLELRVELSSIGPRKVAVETPTVPLAAVMGAVDVDGDGRSEVFVRTTAGASTALGSIFRLDDDDLVRLSFEGVGPLFAVHGAVRHLDGLRCADGGVVLSSAVSDDGISYQVSSLRFGPSEDASVFALLGQETATVPADEVLSEVACDSLPPDWFPGE